MNQWEHDDAIRSMIRRARILAVDDSGSQQLVDLAGLKSERPKKVHRFQQPGITHHPPNDAEGFLLAMAGRSDRAVLIGGEHKDKRPRNTPVGGTVLYDCYDNIISIIEPKIRMVHSAEIWLEAPKIVLKGNVHLGDDGGELVHRKGDIDSDADIAVGSATKVYAV